MKFVQKVFVSIVFVLGWHSVTFAATMEKVNELYTKSGMEEQIKDLALSAENGFDEVMAQQGTLPEESTLQFKSLIKDSFSEPIIKPEVVNRISEKMTDVQIDQCLTWLNSDVGQKITQEEIKASDPSSDQEIRSFAADFQKNPPDAQRLAVVNQLMEKIQVLDYTASVAVTLQKAIAFFMAAPSDYANPRFETMLNQIDASKEMIKEKVRPEVELRFPFAYRNVSSDELKNYCDFLSSDAGRNFMEVSKAGLLNGLKIAGERLGKQYREQVPAQ